MLSVIVYFLSCLLSFWVSLTPGRNSLDFHFMQLGGKLIIHCKLVRHGCVCMHVIVFVMCVRTFIRSQSLSYMAVINSIPPVSF